MKRCKWRLAGAIAVVFATLGFAFAMCAFANGPNNSTSTFVANAAQIENGPWCGEEYAAEAFDVVVENAVISIENLPVNSICQAGCTAACNIEKNHVIVAAESITLNPGTATTNKGEYDAILPTIATTRNFTSTDANNTGQNLTVVINNIDTANTTDANDATDLGRGDAILPANASTMPVRTLLSTA